MTTPRWPRVKDVFQDAVMRPPDARAAFLDQACEADGELRREVESLLASHEDAGRFLLEPAPFGPDAAEAAASVVRTRVGPYRVLDVIAQGGMGTVYRAVRDDDAFEKTVAVKLVRGAASEYAERRFRQERQILARLEHPSIATILDGGATPEGQPYLVMEHVDGRPITAYCDERGLDTRDRLALFVRVCGAVQYAHQNLVVHRDLKPDNVLVTIDGTPKLLDFGIAKLLAVGVDPDVAPTATLLPMMTPQYASPEQVRGEPVTTASDVYSLGVLLYELLAGSRPYAVKADSMEEIVRAVCETEPPAPSSAVAKSLAFDEEMLRADPKNSQVQRDVSWDLGFLAELAAAQGKLEEALAHQRLCLELDQARAAASPDSYQARKDLAESWSFMSDLLNRLRRFPPALQASRQSLALFQDLRRGNPDQTRVQQLMALQYGRHAALLDTLGTHADACLAYDSSLGLWRQLSSKGAAIDAENRRHRVDTEAAAARCDRMVTAR